jgi:hypothetical protein
LFWAALLALILSGLHIELLAPLRGATEYLSAGLVPVALITLGMQLNRSRVKGDTKLLSLVTVIRLLVSPLLALLLVALWSGISGSDAGIAGRVLIIAAGMPVAVNVFILASEYQQDTNLASQTIFWTTALSSATLTAWLAFLHV